MQGYYRVDQDNIFMFARWVKAPDYELTWEDRDTYSYPTEGGWYLFNTLEEATTFFGIPLNTYCMGYPEET